MSLGYLFAMSLPALVAALFVLAVVERFVRGKKKGTPMSAAGIGELGATFEAGKREEIEFRNGCCATTRGTARRREAGWTSTAAVPCSTCPRRGSRVRRCRWSWRPSRGR